MDMQSLNSLKLGEEEPTHAMMEEVLLGTPKGQTPFMISMRVLGALEPQEKVTESESINDREGSIKSSLTSSKTLGAKRKEQPSRGDSHAECQSRQRGGSTSSNFSF